MSLNPDSFERHKELEIPRGTQPLAEPQAGQQTAPLAENVALRATVERTYDKAGKLYMNLENRVELLMRACEAAKLPVPGVELAGYQHPITPKGEKIVVYLQKAITAKPEFARQLQVAIFRYHEAGRTLEKTGIALAQEHAMLDEVLEDLKLKFFYLSNYYQEFKGDPILNQLFPPPKSKTGITGLAGTGAVSPTDLLAKQEKTRAEREARDTTLRQTEALLREWAPRMNRAKLVLGMIDKSGPLTDFLDQTRREARFLAKKVAKDPVAVGQLRSALEMFGHLKATFQATIKQGPLEPLQALQETFKQVVGSLAAYPVLADFCG